MKAPKAALKTKKRRKRKRDPVEDAAARPESARRHAGKPVQRTAATIENVLQRFLLRLLQVPGALPAGES